MKQNSPAANRPQNPWLAVATLTFYLAFRILSGPRIGFAAAAWLAPFCLLYYYRVLTLPRKLLWALLALYAGELIPSMEVIPFPLPVMAILTLLFSLKNLLILQLDKWQGARLRGFVSTLFYPAAITGLEYLQSQGGGGSWGVVANSQYSFPWLLQLASVTGLWGISFLVVWTASAGVWLLQPRPGNKSRRPQAALLLGTLLLVGAFGALRYYASPEAGDRVKMAGLSVPQVGFLEALYKDYSGKDITLDPAISLTSPVLQEVNRAQIPFIESADSTRFPRGWSQLKAINDSLFALSQQVADQGARIICWSEANALMFRSGENAFIKKGQAFAAKNRVYLVMTMGVLDPGKITPGKKFLENKILLLGPDGRVLNVFHKNNPVPLVESSQRGDGRIPVLSTPYGRLATSICYDGDFPRQMQQLGAQQAGLLLLPSGDWHAIAPYHTQMAVFRGIENGCSLVRQVSNGLSIATDYRGRVYASMDYFLVAKKCWVATVPVGHVPTIYNRLGDSWAFACLGWVVFSLAAAAFRSLKSRKAQG